MNKEEKIVLQRLTGNDSLQAVALSELEDLVSAYPYFAAAHLLLTKKMQAEQHEATEEQLQKTALFFPNEQWLRHLMLDGENEKPAESTEDLRETTAATVVPDVTETQALLAEETGTSNAEPQPATEARHRAEIKPVASPQVTGTLEPEKDSPFTETNRHEEVSVTDEEEDEEDDDDEDTSFIAYVQEEPEFSPLDEEELSLQNGPLPLDAANQKIASLLSEQAQEFLAPVQQDAELKIETEPYHTIDYFASQGIKLEHKAETAGFDKKVHKFTDWLRKMKKISAQPIDLGTEAEEEQLVENIAANSNVTKQILTESMAEVLLKQEKNEQAIEVYQKLSLLYPAKSAYFAAKIEQIKL